MKALKVLLGHPQVRQHLEERAELLYLFGLLQDLELVNMSRR